MTNEELTNAINSTYLLMLCANSDAKEGKMPYEPWAELSVHFSNLLDEQRKRAMVGKETLR